MPNRTRPTAGIFGLTGCAGDQLVILNCEDELLALVELLDVRDFLMASSAADPAHLDLALVEGAVATRRDEERLRRIRERSDRLVAIGTCAVWGGVTVLDRFLPDRPAMVEDIYGPVGRQYDQAPARALHHVVPVDYAITGCPIEKHEFLDAVAGLLNGNPPESPGYPVCAECRMREVTCLLIERGLPCCGPVTAAGCNARCPALGVPCVGCRGPTLDANVASLVEALAARGLPRDAARLRLESFGPVPAGHGSAEAR
jgi:coenzyme F420-reducing hydrogenase gamma subunit